MGDSTYFPHEGTNVAKLCDVVVSFAANTAADPVVTTIRGEKIASVTYVSTGKYLVTLNEGYNYVGCPVATIDDSADDGAYATASIVSETAVPFAFNVFTRAATGTKTNYASPRRVYLRLALKNASFGA